MKAIIVQGCKTDHGGVVMQGHPTMSINGIGMAGKGYMVACPKCKGLFPISEGLDSFTLPSDIPVALADMKTACGARLLPSSFLVVEPYRVCRRVNILRDYPDDKIKIYP